MSTSVANTLATPSVSPSPYTSDSKATQQAQAAQAEAESVQISLQAQVLELNHEGLSAATIASQLGITVADVNSYLGLVTATQQALVQQAVAMAGNAPPSA